MQNKTERMWRKKFEKNRFGFVSITGYSYISSCDLLLTGSCQRYDRVITALTQPSAISSTCQKKKKTMMHSLVQRQSVINTISLWMGNLKMSDDNLGMCWQQHNLRWACHRQIVRAGLVAWIVRSLSCAAFKGLRNMAMLKNIKTSGDKRNL